MCMVSVIMPVYNSKAYLKESLESVMHQTYQNWELLAVNEYGSDDGSADLLRAYEKKDPRIHLIKNEKRLGLAESLNQGFHMAGGKYLARLDADDLAAPKRLEKQVQYMEEHPKVGILGTYQHHFGPYTDWIHQTPVTPAQCRAGLLFGCDLCHSTLMLRKEIVEQYHLYYDNSYLAEDYELWTRALFVTEIANLPEVLGEYRIGEDNITNAKKEKLDLESGYLVASTLKRSLGYELPESRIWFFRGWENPFLKYEEKERTRYFHEFEKVLREIIKKNQKVQFFEEKELLRVIDAKWRWAKFQTVWNEKREVNSVDEIFRQKGKATYFFKKIFRRFYYAVKYRTVDVILKQLWHMEGKTGRELAGIDAKIDARIDGLKAELQLQTDLITDQIITAIAGKWVQERKNAGREICNIIDHRIQEAELKYSQALDARVWKAEQNLSQALDGRIWKAEETVSQALDGRIWKAEQNLNQALDGRVWKAEEMISQALDGRVWKAEQNVSQVIDGRVWKAEEHLLDVLDAKVKSIIKVMPRTVLSRLTVHLTEHCNLNCQCCDNFSPIAQEQYTDLQALRRDFYRLRELTGGNIGSMELSGGEALLHPQICDFMQMTRDCFAQTDIQIVTNGILLLSMPDTFWECCHKYHISIVITKYPIQLDMEGICRKAEKSGVYWRYYDNEDVRKTIFMPLDPKGMQDGRSNFLQCYHANECIYLRDGRIYTCSIAANIRHFNKFFNEHLPDTQDNSIDIYQAECMQEVFAFLSRPIPLCNYCEIGGRQFGLDWGVSKRDKREWTKSEG